MKKRLIAMVVTMMAVLCLCGIALAENSVINPLKVSMQLSSNTFTEAKSITVSIQVTNVGESDMPGPVTLYYPNGNKVEEFGSPVLGVGQSQSWSGTWKVTQAQLESERITFKVRYSICNEAGELVNQSKSFTKKIKYEGAVTTMQVNRTIVPTTAKKGQQVKVTYDIVNTGTVTDSKITIKEDKSISSKTVSIKDIEPGEKASYTFTMTMGTKNLTSKPTVSYTAGGKTHKVQLDEATIRFGEVKLSASLSCDKKGGNPGEKAMLTLTMKNTGKTDVTGISVTDPVLGEVFSSVTVKASETLKLEREVEIDQTREYRFSVLGQDTSGLDIAVNTDRVTVQALDPSQAIALSVNCTADRDMVYSLPGTVKFRVAVTNNSAMDVSNVRVYAVDTLLYTFPTIAAGATKEFTRDVNVSMAGTFAFNARTANQLNETVRFNSNTMYIGYARPTAVPTEAPIVTPPKPSYEPLPTAQGLTEQQQTTYDSLMMMRVVFYALCAVNALLVLAGFVRIIQRKAAHAAAQDSLPERAMRKYDQKPGKGGASDHFPEADPADAIQTESAAEGDDLLDAQVDEQAMQQAVSSIYGDDSSDAPKPRRRRSE